MAEPVTIAVDVMGGDRGPAVVLRGALQALEADPDLRLTLVGPAEEVEPFAAAHDRATAQAATEVIEMGSIRPAPCAPRRTPPSSWAAVS